MEYPHLKRACGYGGNHQYVPNDYLAFWAAATFFAPFTEGHPRPFLRVEQEVAVRTTRAEANKSNDLFFIFSLFV
jgi:hypothetical protein